MNSKKRRIAAIAGISLLVLMYLLCLIFALIKAEWADSWFKAALGMTIAVPILLYAFLMLTKLDRENHKKDAEPGQKKQD